ncbi:MAG: MBL fold metallo-hydrolase [Elusimicrobia bacterium]|nr:MBL fold metallo-hydrolase [Elusimicrobiota bacterium]
MTRPEGSHFDGERFHNLDRSKTVRKGFRDVLKWRFSKRPMGLWPERAENEFLPDLPRSLDVREIAVTGINHATDLIQFQGLNVITDPVFSDRVSPVSWAGPRRVRPPGLAYDALPKIDVVLVSHNHYDHMDLPSLSRLHRRDKSRFVVPLGNARTLQGAGIEGAVELDWWQETPLADGATATLVPVQHWSGRGLFDRRRALWGGFYLRRGPASVFFAGDTGYGDHFKLIRERLGSPDLSLLPIGAYEPRWFMKDQHVNPDEAVLAHLDLGSRVSVGMHFGTFRLTDEGMDDPVRALEASRRERGVADDAFRALHNGLTVRAGRAP